MQDQVNMVDGVEQTNLNPISFIPVWFLLNLTLCYLREAQRFSKWRVQDVIFEDIRAHIAAAKSISLHWVSNCRLKTQDQ